MLKVVRNVVLTLMNATRRRSFRTVIGEMQMNEGIKQLQECNAGSIKLSGGSEDSRK